MLLSVFSKRHSTRSAGWFVKHPDRPAAYVFSDLMGWTLTRFNGTDLNQDVQTHFSIEKAKKKAK